jgi:peptidoglycan glycosyltransferase
VVGLAIAAVAVVFLTTRGGAPERAVARRYLSAWSRDDFPAMYALLDPASQRALSEPAFAAAYRSAADTATLVGVVLVRIGSVRSETVAATVLARTRLFGALREAMAIPLLVSGDTAQVRFTPTLLFPGLRAGERLHRTTVMPPRADILAADGTPLAAGPARSSPIPSVASAIAGVLGPIPAAEAQGDALAGYPPGTLVGQDGLERIFQTELAGRPGGSLLAGARVLATRPPIAGHTLRTTIDPKVEEAIVGAMAGRYAGITALDPRTGAILGAAGIAFSDPQPPGSTMKIVTATGVLSAGLAHLTDTFPYATQSDIGGYILHNADGESCGGTLVQAFATSCNSVYAPLGVRLGADRFLATAERFGFNHPSPLSGEAASTVPAAGVRASAADLGASAIGQGEVEATALEMADVAATIAMGGRRPVPTLRAGAPPRFVPVTTTAIAGQVQTMMVAVVNSGFGTGGAAAIPGVEVAGKTGTAEIQNTVNPDVSNPKNTDSWFVAYAPVGAPRIAVAALFPNSGAGAAVAAPAVRQVLEAGLSG